METALSLSLLKGANDVVKQTERQQQQRAGLVITYQQQIFLKAPESDCQ